MQNKSNWLIGAALLAVGAVLAADSAQAACGRFGRLRGRIRARWGGSCCSTQRVAGCAGGSCRLVPADFAPSLPVAPTVVPTPDPPSGSPTGAKQEKQAEQSAAVSDPEAPRIDTSTFQESPQP